MSGIEFAPTQRSYSQLETIISLWGITSATLFDSEDSSHADCLVPWHEIEVDIYSIVWHFLLVHVGLGLATNFFGIKSWNWTWYNGAGIDYIRKQLNVEKLTSWVHWRMKLPLELPSHDLHKQFVQGGNGSLKTLLLTLTWEPRRVTQLRINLAQQNRSRTTRQVEHNIRLAILLVCGLILPGIVGNK